MILHQSRSLWHKKALVQPEGAAVPYVQSCFWRRQDARAYAAMLEQAQRQGVALQRLLAQGSDWPWHWVRTHFVPGEVMARPYLEPLHLQALARTLAGLHGMRGERFGPAFEPSFLLGRTPMNVTLARCRWAVARSHADAAVKHSLWRWIEAHGHVLAGASRFSLTHGDLKTENMIWSAQDGRVYLIDYGNMRYNWAELELAALLQGKLRHPGRRAVFLEAYLALCPTEVAQRWLRHAQAYQVLQLLLNGYRRWVQWRFPLFSRADTPTAQRRVQDLNLFVQRAHELACGARE